ncbi:MAG: hypothetical protein KDK26_01940 [Roseivivax sp.]|nr:hypothetical protein [Roseivivax sp.]
MTRILAAVLLLTSGAAFAQEAAKPSLDQACKTTALIADRVVTLRKEGKTRNRAEKLVVSQLTEDAKRYMPAIYMTLDWAYALPEDALNADIKGDWERQCMAAGGQ